MNKINIVNNELKKTKLDKSIECSFDINDRYGINVLKLIIKKSTDIELDIEALEELTIEINVLVLDNVTSNIYENINGKKAKIRSKYELKKDSNLIIKKINNIDSIKEQCIFSLNGEKASVKRVLKTISCSNEKYDVIVNHNSRATKSDIINHGVNIEKGTLVFDVSSIVPEDMDKCYVNQSNRIINLTNNKCSISPNMYIDCFDVIANHSAFIGTFKDDELFYLQSRGIDKIEATKLLIRGFLTSELSEEQKETYNKIIDKYWR